MLSRWVYRACCGLVRLFCPAPTFEGLENLPEGGCVIAGNHAQMYGPIIAELYISGDRAVWCSAEMMHLREVPDYAFRDFWSRKPRSVRWFFRLASYLIAPLAVCLFNNAHCIGVYRDMRIMGTMRETVRRIAGGARIIIFPEHEVFHNAIVYDFQDRFIDVARFYHHQTGQALDFVPMYVAPSLKKVVFSPPIRYNPEAQPNAERRRICDALMSAITQIACAQPRHRVMPYPNLPRGAYPYNKPDEEADR